MGLVNRIFYHVGKFSASHPLTAILACVSVSIVCSLGLINLKLEDDPQALWVSPTSRGNKEQSYFREKYGAFFRTEQIIFKRRGSNERDRSIDLFKKPYLEMIYHIQTAMESDNLEYKGQHFNITDLCFKPITGKGCLVTSPMEFWLMNLTDMWVDEDYKETARCIRPRVKRWLILLVQRPQHVLRQNRSASDVSCDLWQQQLRPQRRLLHRAPPQRHLHEYF